MSKMKIMIRVSPIINSSNNNSSNNNIEEEEEEEGEVEEDYDSSDDETVVRRMHKNNSNRASTAAGMNGKEKEKKKHEPAIESLHRCTQKVNRHDQKWMGMFQKLVEYKNQHKNTMVPQRYDEDPKLGEWASKQRCHYKKDELNPNRYALLNSIGFKWVGDNNGGSVVDNEKWMSVFQRLVEYKNQHRNTTVPRRYDEDLKLGRWVSKQRCNYKTDKLLPNRCALLNSIGFNLD